jgi:hypothetical protein
MVGSPLRPSPPTSRFTFTCPVAMTIDRAYTIAVSSCNGVKRTRDTRRQCGRAGGDVADATSTREILIFFYRHMKLWRASSAFFFWRASSAL